MAERSSGVSACVRCERLRARRLAGACCAGVGTTPLGHVPMTHGTAEAVRERIAKLDLQLTRMTPDALRAAQDNIADATFFITARQLEVLRQLLSKAEIVAPDGCALLGSTVTLDTGDGQGMLTVTLTSADDTDVHRGRISVDGPLGVALLGRREGELVRYSTPAGERTARVTALR